MVREGGAYGALPGGGGAGGEQRPARRHAQFVSKGTLAGLAAVVALAVVIVDGGRHAIGVERGAGQGDELLQSPPPHDLHFANSLKEPEVVDKTKAAADGPGTLTEAQMQAQNRIRQLKARTAGKHAHMSAEAREEMNLKAELDADTRKKQGEELHASLKGQDMHKLLSMTAGAKRAKDLKVPLTKAKGADGDQREEAALRAQLDSEVKERQAQLFMQGETKEDLRGRQAVGAAERVDKGKLTESQLEAELRNQLDHRVNAEKQGMFKHALATYLAANVGTTVAASVTGAPAPAPAPAQAGAVAAKGGEGGGSASLRAAERIMKMSLMSSRHSVVPDTTLAHQSLGSQRHAATSKAGGLAGLEAAMLQQSMAAARKDAPKLAHEHAQAAALKSAAKEKAAQAHTPSYRDAMLAFSKRLVTKETAAEAHLAAVRRAARATAPQATQQGLEAAIKRKVDAKLAAGSAKLAEARAQLRSQFSGAHSLFGKAEQAELRDLSDKRKAQLRQVDVGTKGAGAWTL